MEVVRSVGKIRCFGFRLYSNSISLLVQTKRLQTQFSLTPVLFCFRVIYLQVSMNDGLSFISSNVHITTTECVSDIMLSSSLHFFKLQSYRI